MPVTFRSKDRVYADREKKKKPMPRVSLVPVPEIEAPTCVMSKYDICMRCLEHAQEVLMTLYGEHYECPTCRWRCKCWR